MKKLLIALAVFCLVSCGDRSMDLPEQPKSKPPTSKDGGGAGGTVNPFPDKPTDVSLLEIIQNDIFSANNKCTGCHGAAGMMNLRLTDADTSFANLVDVTSS